MNLNNILIVDDEEEFRNFLASFLKKNQFITHLASCYEDAEEISKKRFFDLALIDLSMPGKDGIEVLKMLKNTFPEISGIIMTGYGSIETAVNSMRSGAFDYITKPFNHEEILLTINRALEMKKLRGENIFLRSQLKNKYKFENIIGDSEPMQKMYRIIEKVSGSDSTVLINGDSGTGKELVAQAIHYNSNRHNKLLVPVNCGAIPEELLESELFGHIKGAFTGAITDRVGRFEIAEGGSIFLDEIGDMSPKLQVKLLRVLQAKEFEPIGSTKTKKSDVRVIAATNQNLESLVEKKLFREDLFYRLNVIPISLPKLQERKSDIPLLVKHFLSKLQAEQTCSVEEVDESAMKALMDYHWPGNVRELENLLERIVILNPEAKILELDHFPDKIKNPVSQKPEFNISITGGGVDLNKILNDIENNLIIQALKKSRGEKASAARLLGINRTTLVEKIKKKGIKKKEED